MRALYRQRALTFPSDFAALRRMGPLLSRVAGEDKGHRFEKLSGVRNAKVRGNEVGGHIGDDGCQFIKGFSLGMEAGNVR